MDLTLLSQLAQILSGIAVVIAIVFGMAQIRQYQQQRLDAAALELMLSMQDREFTHAFGLIYPMVDSVGRAELRALGPEHEDAALALATRFETVGLLVFRGSIPISLVEEIVGGAAVILWGKLKPWAAELRAEQKHELLFEWYEWLVDRMIERGRPKQIPAYHRCRDWKPPR